MYFSLLHGAAKILNYRDFSILYKQSGSKIKLRIRAAEDYRYRCVVFALKINRLMGYLLLHKL